MNDFSQEARASAWWATDTRRAISGQLLDVILEKRGEKKRDDLSGVEAVRMGLTLQPAIAAIFTEVTGIETRPLDIAGTHRSEPWLRSHFDFLAEDGGLVEVKNYNAAVINKYNDEGDENVRIPPADYWQCLHEAVVYNAPHVYFCVLFGGQRFRHWKFEFSDFERELLLKRTAEWWGMYQSGNLPSPENAEQAKIAYSIDNGEQVIADATCERYAEELKHVKSRIKELETLEDAYQTALMNRLGTGSELVTIDGSVLVTWKNSKPTKRFDVKALEAEMPEIYKRFLKEQPGARRFLVK